MKKPLGEANVSPQAGEYWWAEITKNEIEPVFVDYKYGTKELYCEVIGWDAGIGFDNIIKWICKIEKPK